METVTDFIFLGSKLTADGDCSHEIKRRLLLGRKARINRDSVLKSRDITLPTKDCLFKAMIFSVVIYGCESWTLNKAECQKIDAFEVWFWRRLASPMDSKSIKPVKPKGNQPWIFIGRTNAEKYKGQEEKGQKRMRWLDGQHLHPYMTTGKTITLMRRTFVGKVISLLYIMLFRFFIAFLPRSKYLLMTAATICSDFGAPKNKVYHCFQCFPIYFPRSGGTGCQHLHFMNAEF